MGTNQFFKGLAMALVAVLVAAFSTQPIDWLLLAVTAGCAILTYSGKNLIAVLHSDSPPGSLSFINLASALLVALGAGILEGVGLFIIDGAINWIILGKVVLSITFTYLGGTWFAPPYNTEKKRVFASKRYISRYLKGAAVIGLFLFFSASASAQGPFDGFFKPKAGTSALSYRAEGDQFHDWFFRPAAQMTAIQFTWDKELQQFQSSTFSAAGIGLGYQHYVEHNGTLVNNYGLNALIVFDASQGSAGAGAALTINALQFVNVGIGYSITNKAIFIPVGAVYNF